MLSSSIGFFLVDDVDGSRSSLLDRLLQEWCKVVDHLGSLMMMMMIKDGLMMASAKRWFDKVSNSVDLVSTPNIFCR